MIESSNNSRKWFGSIREVFIFFIGFISWTGLLIIANRLVDPIYFLLHQQKAPDHFGSQVYFIFMPLALFFSLFALFLGIGKYYSPVRKNEKMSYCGILGFLLTGIFILWPVFCFTVIWFQDKFWPWFLNLVL